MLDEFTGPISCSSFIWTADEQREPFYFKNDNPDTPVWVRYSPECYMDFSDSRVTRLTGGISSNFSGILIMIRPEDSIIVTGGGSPNSPVSFQLPFGAIIFANPEGVFCHDSTPFRNATVAKTFTESGTNNSLTIPAGLPSNNGHGDFRLFSNKLFGSGDPYIPTPSSSNFILHDLNVGVSKIELDGKGYITSNNILRCKFAHISTGSSFCYLRGLSCDAGCVPITSSLFDGIIINPLPLISSSSVPTGTSSSSSGGFICHQFFSLANEYVITPLFPLYDVPPAPLACEGGDSPHFVVHPYGYNSSYASFNGAACIGGIYFNIDLIYFDGSFYPNKWQLQIRSNGYYSNLDNYENVHDIQLMYIGPGGGKAANNCFPNPIGTYTLTSWGVDGHGGGVKFPAGVTVPTTLTISLPSPSSSSSSHI